MRSQGGWEFWFKACSAAAAVASTLGFVVGGTFALYTYHHQSVLANELKTQEVRLMQYNQKKEVYYELSDAAAAVATSTSKEAARKNAAKYLTLYFGRAHIFAIDPGVNTAKIAFRDEMNKALQAGTFPSSELEDAALALTSACKDVLRVEEVFSGTRGPKKL